MLGTIFELIGIVLNPIGFVLDIIKESVVPRNGAIVFCKIGPLEHSGVYISSYRQILHRNRYGDIELVPPEVFTWNDGDTIFVSCHDSESIESSRTANRALAHYQSAFWEPYDIIKSNCHTLVANCVTAENENLAFTFFMLEVELRLSTGHNNWRMWKTDDGSYLY